MRLKILEFSFPPLFFPFTDFCQRFTFSFAHFARLWLFLMLSFDILHGKSAHGQPELTPRLFPKYH